MARLNTINLTETQFINAEIAVWGELEVEDLIERGFTPRLTTNGWTWVMPVQDRKRAVTSK